MVHVFLRGNTRLNITLQDLALFFSELIHEVDKAAGMEKVSSNVAFFFLNGLRQMKRKSGNQMRHCTEILVVL